ncbi:MAG: asparagine synthase (glutamine-hydrolyzing) [Chloroflexota bacterium]|nr:asparagine synthase (glutamine-hydrolyzing) [Chloroflexota bacterium]
MVGLRGGEADPVVVRRMAAMLEHRGPDEEGAYVSGPVGLGFRRLSILDLKPTGHQPMRSDDGQLVMVFNGEIFNYIELRRELQSLGHHFKSSGDTEVLLHAYQQWGRDCLRRLNGMWAFLVYDTRAGKIFGARDRFGVKPLYRYRAKDFVFFGSEIKAIRASGHYQARPNWGLTSQLLYGGRLDQIATRGATFYADIEEVPAGSAFELDLNGHLQEWQYWSLGDLPATTVDDPPAEFLRLFTDAVRLRMRSDVPVGVSLSGGLDSTSIISVMARLRAGAGPVTPTASLQAFSYVSPEFDESAYIAQTVEQTGATLRLVDIDPQRLWDTLDRLLWHHDEPVHSFTALIGYEVYRLAAANSVKVVLSGQGADETIGGYPSYFTDHWYTLFRSRQLGTAWSEISEHCRAHGGDRRTVFARALRHFLRSELGRSTVYRSLAQARRHRALAEHPWFTPELRGELRAASAEYLERTLHATLERSVELAPLPLYLRVEDRNSMAHSVEARLPFLDYRLVSMLFALPGQWKMRGPLNKYVLREAMRDQIPELVRARVDKMGFPTPINKWFASIFYEPMQDLLASQVVRTRGIYNVEQIRSDLRRHQSGEVDVSNGLFNVAQLECWFNLERHAGYEPELMAS